MNHINKNRILKEIEMLSNSPPAGISCCPADDRLNLLSAQILGEDGTPFEGGVFNLEIQVPDRYPFDPPRIRFVTPIYHPNIDTTGRICLDTLKLPPKGTWRPCLNISTVLMMIRILMGEPGSEDPLMTAIWQEYKYNYTIYVEKAKQWTRQHATGSCVAQGSKALSVVGAKPQDPLSSATRDTKQEDKNSKANQSDTDSQVGGSLTSSSGPKSKKGLGLSNKRHALGEFNVNAKIPKQS